MNWFGKLPGYRRQPPGLERKILRKLPVTLLAGTLIPLFFTMGNRMFAPDLGPAEAAAHMVRGDILAIAIVFIVWMTLLTVAIGCLLVVIMKGPAYAADAYPLIDNEQPRQNDSRATDG